MVDDGLIVPLIAKRNRESALINVNKEPMKTDVIFFENLSYILYFYSKKSAIIRAICGTTLPYILLLFEPDIQQRKAAFVCIHAQWLRSFFQMNGSGFCKLPIGIAAGVWQGEMFDQCVFTG